MTSQSGNGASIGQARPFRRSLVGNFVVVVLILGISLFIVAELTLTRVMEKSSSALAAQIVNRVEGELHGLFGPVGATLQLTLAAARAEVLGTPNLHQVEFFLESLMTSLPQISSVELARQNGHAFMLLKDEEGWLSRQMRPDEWGIEALWRRRSTDGVASEWRAPFEYEVTKRPWFTGAAAHHGTGGERADGSAVAWTDPYTFATTGDPGVTASAAIEEQDGELLVISLDVLLRDLSRFALDVTRNKPGQVFILDSPPDSDEVRLLGVPFESGETPGALLPVLETPASVGGVIADFSTFATGQTSVAEEPLRFTSDQDPWWGVAKRAELDPEHDVWIVVLIPEHELREGLPPVHRITILATLLMLVVGVVLARRLARTYSEPVDGLVLRSQRMERLNFEPVAEPVRSRITELRQLAGTFESLRQALDGFTGQREDLRIAEAIHQTLSPEEALVVPPIEAAGWREQSSEIGGASFDLAVLPESSKGIAALLLDLDGHGIETATTVARLSSVFRAAVGTGQDTGQVAAQLIEAGNHLTRPATLRFWLARVEAESGRVEVASAGVAWLVVEGEPNRPAVWHGGAEVATPTPPLVPLDLAAGGTLVAVTSGVLEAADEQRHRWGREGVESTLGETSGGSVAGQRDALVAALETHLDGSSEDMALVILGARS